MTNCNQPGVKATRWGLRPQPLLFARRSWYKGRERWTRGAVAGFFWNGVRVEVDCGCVSQQRGRMCDHVCIDVYDCDTRTVPVMVYIGSSSVLVHRGKGRRSSWKLHWREMKVKSQLHERREFVMFLKCDVLSPFSFQLKRPNCLFRMSDTTLVKTIRS